MGVWKTIDDDGKTEKSLVRITESAGVLTGKIEKIFEAGKQDSTCDKCTDERKDQPVLGMVILRNLKQDADDKEALVRRRDPRSQQRQDLQGATEAASTSASCCRCAATSGRSTARRCGSAYERGAAATSREQIDGEVN